MKAFYLPSGLTADEVANGLRAEDSATRDSDIFILARKFLEVQKELEAIKKQEPFGYFLPDNGGNVFTASKDNLRIAERFNWPVISLYAKPVYQHSFSVDGHTFYADNEVDILYLERKFGVGGKAKLNLVEDK